MGGLGGAQTFMHEFRGQRTFSGHWASRHVPGLFKPLGTAPHDSDHHIPSIFALTMVHGHFNNKPFLLGIFRTNRDRTKSTLGQFIFTCLIHHLSWTSLSKPNSLSSRVSLTPIVKTCNGTVPRPFTITNNNLSYMIWRSQQSVPVWNLFQRTSRFNR